MDNSQEIWKDYTGSIKAFHGLIKVSNYGRIYKVGTNTSKNQSGILKCTKNTYGYVGYIFQLMVRSIISLFIG